MKLNIIIEEISSSLFVASCPNLPGCFVEAESMEAARTLLTAAIRAYIQSCKNRYEKVPYYSAK